MSIVGGPRELGRGVVLHKQGPFPDVSKWYVAPLPLDDKSL